MKKEDKKLFYAGGIVGAIASLCCVGPVVLVPAQHTQINECCKTLLKRKK